MERFAISFDTSKTCLNYNEFVPNQVFTLPGGAYMSTHLDDDGSHRVSINLESLLGRKYKIVLNAKANTNAKNPSLGSHWYNCFRGSRGHHKP